MIKQPNRIVITRGDRLADHEGFPRKQEELFSFVVRRRARNPMTRCKSPAPQRSSIMGSTLSGYPVVMSLILSSRAVSVDPQLAMPVPEHLKRIVYYHESIRVDIGDDLFEFR